MGYDSEIVMHKKESCGVIIAWKCSTFEFEDCKSVNFDHLANRYGASHETDFRKGNVGLLCILKHKETDHKILVANTHFLSDHKVIQNDYVKYA